jgi:hypothetical protein
MAKVETIDVSFKKLSRGSDLWSDSHVIASAFVLKNWVFLWPCLITVPRHTIPLDVFSLYGMVVLLLRYEVFKEQYCGVGDAHHPGQYNVCLWELRQDRGSGLTGQ